MHQKTELNSAWLKAAVLGCLWASSEIVLGSFLHNIKAPFTGVFLTAIGIVLMVSVSTFWKEKGIIWRAGLVCAMMKSISPSAVIFGPMIAILSQALLMEFSVRVFRKNLLGYLIGGMLAMSWNLVHLTFTYLIIYGTGLINIYINLTHFAEKQLGIAEVGYWMPIFVLFGVYVIIGAASSLFGFYIGNKVVKAPAKMKSISVKEVEKIKTPENKKTFPHSITWLIIDFLLLLATLAVLNFSDTIYWLIAGCVVITIWSFRYKGSIRRLAKPAFWITFLIITMLSSVLFVEFGSNSKNISEGLLIGLQMNFRAAVMIIGFSALSTELGNKKIQEYFIKSWFKQLPAALEVAFDALPQVISNLPKISDIFKRPVGVLYELVNQADFWLEQVNLKFIKRKNIVLLQGSKQEGKTTFLTEINEMLKLKGIKTGGILAPAFFNTGVHLGYDIINIKTDERKNLSRISGRDDMPIVGHYYFYEESIAFGKNSLIPENLNDVDIIFIDEVGPWELENQGWADNINKLVKETSVPMIWAIRRGIAQKIIDKWSLDKASIYDVVNANANEVAAKLIELVDTTNAS